MQGTRTVADATRKTEISQEKIFRHRSTLELLTEAAGVKIFVTPESNRPQPSNVPSVSGNMKTTVIIKNPSITGAKRCGFNLTKSKWDLYPWVNSVDAESPASFSGLRVGDCLINVNGADLMGLSVWAIKELFPGETCTDDIRLSVWRCEADSEEGAENENALKGPLPEVAGRLADAVRGAVRALECPVCLESSTPPTSQCVHGHIICARCRPRTSRCPVCRVQLGQGRCLLADKLDKVLRDVLVTEENSSVDEKPKHCDLQTYLFGRGKTGPTPTTKDKNVAPKAKSSLLTRLLTGGAEKAASADNLTTVTLSIVRATNPPGTSSACGQRLKLHDRTKSASTGELAGATNQRNSLTLESSNNSAVSSTASLTSITVPTPRWGGSADSLCSGRVTCPLSRQTGCKDTVPFGTLLDHLKGTHQVPQVHFYSANVNIPLPLPFGTGAVYVLHCGTNIFFFQYEREAAWMSSSPDACQAWQWILHGSGKDGTEIKLRRSVASLEGPFTLHPQNVAPLPSTLLLHTLNVRIVEYRSNEQLNI